VVVTARDGSLRGTASFTWTVTNTNRAPGVTSPGAQTSAEGAAVILPITATDPDGTALTYSATGLPAGLAIDPATGVISGTVGFDAAPSYSVVVTASDGSLTGTASFTWTVTNTNRAPVANAATFQTPRNRPVSGFLTASDPDGDSVTFSIVKQPGKGTVVLDPETGAFTYTPKRGASGSDSFTFKASDGTLDSNVATIRIQFVTATTNPPVANDSSVMTQEDTATSGTLSASDGDGDVLSYRIAANAAKGTVVITNASTGAFVYTPILNAYGTDSFTFVANDGTADSNAATVTVTITPVNDPPIANPDTATTRPGTPVTVAVLANDTDPDGDQLHLAAVNQPLNGTVTSDADGAVTYVPTFGFSGVATFTYQVADPSGATSSLVTVTIRVESVNHAPVAMSGTIVVAAGGFVDGALVATDTDGDALTYEIVTGPKRGTVQLNAANGLFRYSANPGAKGSDSFTFRVSDGTVYSNTAKITVTIR